MIRAAILTVAALAVQAGCLAQGLVDPARYPLVRAVFDKSPSKPGIGCEVVQLKPDLNYSFRYQAGYAMSWPLKAYSGNAYRFAVFTRVTPRTPEGSPVYFSQTARLRTIPHGAKEKLRLDGAFFLGEGEYTLDVVLVDQNDLTCRKQWQVKVKPQVAFPIRPLQAPGSVAPAIVEPWDGNLPNLDSHAAKRLTILMHVAPLYSWTNKLHAYDQAMLLSALAALLKQTTFTDVKLIAFNLDQQTEIYHQERFDAQGWNSLVAAMRRLELGTVSYQVLQNRNGHADLLASLIDEELLADHPADAVLFLGPTARQKEKLRLAPEQSEAVPPPFFYFEFKPYWSRGAEFPDILDHLTRSASGKVFHIHSPREFVEAIAKMERLSAQRQSPAAGLH